MKQYLTLKISEYLGNAADKKYLNEKMFSVIAPRYNFITRLFSFWQDAAWKHALIASLPSAPAPKCLDLACGTGDLCFLLAAQYPQSKVVGFDLTEEMLVLARQANRYANVCF